MVHVPQGHEFKHPHAAHVLHDLQKYASFAHVAPHPSCLPPFGPLHVRVGSQESMLVVSRSCAVGAIGGVGGAGGAPGGGPSAGWSGWVFGTFPNTESSCCAAAAAASTAAGGIPAGGPPGGGPPGGGPPGGGPPAGAAPAGGPPAGGPPVGGAPGGDWDVREEQAWTTFSLPGAGHSAQCWQ